MRPGLRDVLSCGIFVERKPIDLVMDPKTAARSSDELGALGGAIDLLGDLVGQVGAHLRIVYRRDRGDGQHFTAADPVRDLTESALVPDLTRGVQSCLNVDSEAELGDWRIVFLLHIGIGGEMQMDRRRLLRFRPMLQRRAGFLERFAAKIQAADMHAGRDLVVRYMGHDAYSGGAETDDQYRGKKNDTPYRRTSGRLR